MEAAASFMQVDEKFFVGGEFRLRTSQLCNGCFEYLSHTANFTIIIVMKLIVNYTNVIIFLFVFHSV